MLLGMTCVLRLQCTCGALQGQMLEASAEHGNHMACLCDDCQAYAHHLGRAEDVLDAWGGTEIYQTAPARVRIEAGHEHLRCLRLTETGLVRWYAGCCRTPIANTVAKARVPFAGILCVFVRAAPGATIDEALGPVLARTQARFGYGELPPNAHPRAPFSLIWHALKVFGRAFWRGEHRPSPFFDAQTGRLIVEPEILTLDQLESAREKARNLGNARASNQRCENPRQNP